MKCEDEWPYEDEDDEMDGFQEIPTPEQDYLHQPARPTVRCKRCGCWLRASRDEEDPSRTPIREYCSACEWTRLMTSRLCATCGKIFVPEGVSEERCPRCESAYRAVRKTCLICGSDFEPYECGACELPVTFVAVCYSCHWKQQHEKAASSREKTCRICGCRFLPRRCIVEGCQKRLTDCCSVCHEEIEHMSMEAYVWTLPDCERCHKIVTVLERAHRRVRRMQIEKLLSGEEPDIEALSQFSMNDGVAPIVFLDNRFLSSAEIDALIAPNDCTANSTTGDGKASEANAEAGS